MTMPEILRRKLMERIDIASEPDDGEVLEEIDGLILGEEETRYLPVAQKAELRRQLFYSVRRLDVLQELLEDAGITEIMVNGYQHIFVERNGRIERYGKSFTSAEKLEDVIQQIVGRCNRVVNEQNPIVDARLENGDRVNVVMKPVALNGPILTIRRFPEQAVTMEFLVSIGSITKEAAEFLQVLVRTRYSTILTIRRFPEQAVTMEFLGSIGSIKRGGRVSAGPRPDPLQHDDRRGDRIWQNDISECAFRLHSKGRAHHNHRRQCRAADPGCGESGAAGSKRGKSGIRNRNYDPRSDPRSFAYAAEPRNYRRSARSGNV